MLTRTSWTEKGGQGGLVLYLLCTPIVVRAVEDLAESRTTRDPCARERIENKLRLIFGDE
jgi:hypothetical protein